MSVVLFYSVCICISGTVNENVHIWHECSVNISKTICNHFEMHSRMLRYVEKPLHRAKHLIPVTLHFKFTAAITFFLIKNDQQFNINMAKSKVIVFKNAKNWADTKLDI